MPDVNTIVAPSDIALSGDGAPHRSRFWLWILGALLVCLAAIGSWLLLRELLKPPPPPPGPALPAITAGARAGDVPVYLAGLGTVQAYNPVTVRFLVNGTLDKVFLV